MAVIIDYDTLVENIIATTEDDSVEFNSFIPTSIDIAEELLFRELELPDLEEKETGSLVASVSTFTKPTGYKFPHFFRIVTDDGVVTLKKRQEDYMVDYWPDATVEGTPKYYGDISSTEFLLVPTPDDTYEYALKFSKQPTKLSVSVDTNYFTDNCQDILYYACMMEMARFMKAWTQLAVWEKAYGTVRDNWNINVARVRRDDGDVPNSPENGPNSLKHTIKSNS